MHAILLLSLPNQALAMPDVYFMTYEQLRQWVLAPVPASQMQGWLKCNAVNFTAEGEPGALVSGSTWERAPRSNCWAQTLTCHCHAERAPCTTYTVKSGDSLW